MELEDLKRFREKHKLTQRELADLLGYSPRTIEGWEQGRNVMGPRPRKVFVNLQRNYR